MAARQKRSTPSPADPLARLQKSMRTLQKDAQRILAQTRQQAGQMIGAGDQRRAFDRMVREARRLRKEFESRVSKMSRQLESKTQKFVGKVEKQVTRRLSSLLKRLDLPSRAEIQALNKRISQIEKRIKNSGNSGGGHAS